MNNNLGQLIWARRRKLGLTLQNVSDAVGVGKGHLSEIENGKVNASFAVITQVARVLGLSGKSLLDAATADRIQESRRG